MQKFTLSARLLLLFAQGKGIRTVASLFREKINISELLTRGKYQKIMSKTADYWGRLFSAKTKSANINNS